MFFLFLADAGGAAAGLAWSGVFLAFLVLVVLASVFWIWAIIDCIKNPALTDGEKVVWVLLLVFMHFIGTLLYYFLAPGKRRA